jgi:signal transduction histidine kinase
VPEFPRSVSLACHDLRTPLATVTGFAKVLLRTGDLDDRAAGYVEMIDAASAQLAELVDELGRLARIEGGSYDPALVASDTLELATSLDERVQASGDGEQIDTDEPAVRRALEALALAAVRHGGLDRVTWTVRGRSLELERVTPDSADVVLADDPRDFAALVARRVIEALGGSLRLDGETLHVSL